jgi:tRNA acetyltransferase TAN1
MPSSNNASSKGTRKRKFHGSGGSGGGGGGHNPKRGPPGMLLTCETGRESKCRREGLEILNYYWNVNSIAHAETEDDATSLSLEEELKQLQQQGHKDTDQSRKEPFHVYDTGCRGTVFVICTLPNAHLIEPIITEYQKTKQQQQDDTASKKSKVDNTTTANSHQPPVWDPVATFGNIYNDRIHPKSTSAAPSSRFVTRMIPVQATCFASPEELRLTATALLQRHFAMEDDAGDGKGKSKSPVPTTFAITTKRRNCHGLPRDKVIEIVASIMEQQQTLGRRFKVDLDNPDMTIVVEVCKTLCGVSIVKNCPKYQNFNLFTAASETGRTPSRRNEKESQGIGKH